MGEVGGLWIAREKLVSGAMSFSVGQLKGPGEGLKNGEAASIEGVRSRIWVR